MDTEREQVAVAGESRTRAIASISPSPAAEKLHAYTRTYRGGGTTRARDLVGLLLIRQHQPPDTTLLRESNRRVFDRRATHPLPRRLPPPPRGLAVASRREAEPVGIPAGLAEAHEVLAHWLDPVLAGGGAG